MLRMLRVRKSYSSSEDLFIERYDWLLGWALQLTSHNRPQSEDLVHDAFVQFTLAGPDPATIQNLEGYLYVVLRNLHLSQVRRANRFSDRPLSVVDYESAETTLRATDAAAQRRELHDQCAALFSQHGDGRLSRRCRHPRSWSRTGRRSPGRLRSRSVTRWRSRVVDDDVEPAEPGE